MKLVTQTFYKKLTKFYYLVTFCFLRVKTVEIIWNIDKNC